jgi:hypothetical protein
VGALADAALADRVVVNGIAAIVAVAVNGAAIDALTGKTVFIKAQLIEQARVKKGIYTACR